MLAAGKANEPEPPHEPFEHDSGRFQEHVLPEVSQRLVEHGTKLVVLFFGETSPVETLRLFTENVLEVVFEPRVDRRELLPRVRCETVQVGRRHGGGMARRVDERWRILDRALSRESRRV